MRQRITKLFAGLAAVGALAVGGSALASASSNAPAAPKAPNPAASVGATGAQRSQSSPDTEVADSKPEATESATEQDPAAEAAAESATEQDPTAEAAAESASEVPGNDGLGGHADELANPNADHQFQGQE